MQPTTEEEPKNVEGDGKGPKVEELKEVKTEEVPKLDDKDTLKGFKKGAIELEEKEVTPQQEVQTGTVVILIDADGVLQEAPPENQPEGTQAVSEHDSSATDKKSKDTSQRRRRRRKPKSDIDSVVTDKPRRRRRKKSPAVKAPVIKTLQDILAEKGEIYGFRTYFRELGYYLSRLEQYSRALKPFDVAVSKTPTDCRALEGRCIARTKELQLQGALEDVNQFLKNHPGNLSAFAHKALITYLCTEFEDALVQYLKASKLSKKPIFTEGAMKCMDAIQNCIGERAGKPLRDYYKIIRRLAWIKVLKAQRPYQPARKRYKKKADPEAKKWEQMEPVSPLHIKCADRRTSLFPDSAILKTLDDKVDDTFLIPPLSHPFPYNPLQRHTTNIKNVLAETYLDRLYHDKIFLQQLPSMHGIKCPNTEGVKKIKKLAKQGYKMLEQKQELMRARRPFYFVKYQQLQISDNLKKKLAEETLQRAEGSIKKAKKLMETLEDHVEEERLKDALDIADKLWNFCKTTPTKYLPDREKYLKKIYELLGKAFVGLKRLNTEQYEWDQIKRINLMLGQEVERAASTDSVLKQFSKEFKDYKRQIKILEDRAKNATCCEEAMWFYHELSRYHLEIKNFGLGRSYAKKCIREADLVNNSDFEINGHTLLARVHVQTHRKHDALREVYLALQIAVETKNTALIEYLKKTVDVIEALEFEDDFGLAGLEKRQQQIVGIMEDSGIKAEVAYLFRKMSSMPSSRRMSVLPGVKMEDIPIPANVSRKQSIAPKAKEVVEFEEKAALKTHSKEPNSVTQLIQFHID